MELQINPTTRVLLEATSRFYEARVFYLQYKRMILQQTVPYEPESEFPAEPVELTWELDPQNPNSIVDLIAEQEEYDAFVGMTEAEQIEFLVAHLQTKYSE